MVNGVDPDLGGEIMKKTVVNLILPAMALGLLIGGVSQLNDVSAHASKVKVTKVYKSSKFPTTAYKARKGYIYSNTKLTKKAENTCSQAFFV